MSREFDMEKLLIDGRNLIAAETLCNEIGNAKEKILEERLVPLLNDFAEAKDLIFDYDVTGSRYSGFSFERKIWNSKYGIAFEFQKIGYQNLCYGINLDDGDMPSASKSEQKTIHNLYPESNVSKWWPCWFWFDNEYRSWSTDDFIKIYKNPKEVAKLITDKVSEILEKIDSMRL